MEKGVIAVKVATKWSASSEPRQIAGGEELAGMAGQWGVNVEINVTMPYSYSSGPIEVRRISDEMRKKDSESA